MIDIQYRDQLRLERAMGILFRLSLENTGWRRLFRRWYYSYETLRHDAAALVQEVGYLEAQPTGTIRLRPLAEEETGNG